jgi:dethiobiotin synthetase
MKIFITGTDTNVGKTVVSSWLCLHSGYGYFKPIQTGSLSRTDSQRVSLLAGCTIYPEVYVYRNPVSPHEAARLESDVIDIGTINLPASNNLVIEGAGGVLVPINQHVLMVDLMKQMGVPVILVANSRLGMINHTLLSLEAMRSRGVKVLGVIVIGEKSFSNDEAIVWYGHTKILAHIPYVSKVSRSFLQQIPLTSSLKEIMREA